MTQAMTMEAWLHEQQVDLDAGIRAQQRYPHDLVLRYGSEISPHFDEARQRAARVVREARQALATARQDLDTHERERERLEAREHVTERQVLTGLVEDCEQRLVAAEQAAQRAETAYHEAIGARHQQRQREIAQRITSKVQRREAARVEWNRKRDADLRRYDEEITTMRRELERLGGVSL